MIGFRTACVFVQWAWAYMTYKRGIRLITGEDGGNSCGQARVAAIALTKTLRRRFIPMPPFVVGVVPRGAYLSLHRGSQVRRASCQSRSSISTALAGS